MHLVGARHHRLTAPRLVHLMPSWLLAAEPSYLSDLGVRLRSPRPGHGRLASAPTPAGITDVFRAVLIPHPAALPSRITTSPGKSPEGAAREHAFAVAKTSFSIGLSTISSPSTLQRVIPAKGIQDPNPVACSWTPNARRHVYSATMPHPPHRPVVDIDVVFAHEIELAVVTDANSDRHAGATKMAAPSRPAAP